MGVKIIKTGRKVPHKKVTNFDLEKILDTTNEWIKDRTGIINRYISTVETSSSLAIEACQELIKDKDINLSEIGLIICATMTPDTLIPTVAANVKKALKIEHSITFDINVAYSGFLYAVSVAESMMKNLNIKKGIVVGVDLNSQLVDWKDRGTAIVFGDGAGSVLLSSEKNSDSGILSTFLDNIDDNDNSLILKNISYKTPFNNLENEYEFFKLEMLGPKVMKFAINAINTSILSVIKSSNISLDKIKYIIPHQANQRIIDAAVKNLKIPKEKFYINIDNYANTSAGSIPIALDELNKNNLLKKGDYIILVGFGGGLSFGAILLKW